jgi:type II secretory pathway component PulC
VNDSTVGSVDDLQRIMTLAEATEVRLTVLRERARQEITVHPEPSLKVA